MRELTLRLVSFIAALITNNSSDTKEMRFKTYPNLKKKRKIYVNCTPGATSCPTQIFQKGEHYYSNREQKIENVI